MYDSILIVADDDDLLLIKQGLQEAAANIGLDWSLINRVPLVG